MKRKTKKEQSHIDITPHYPPPADDEPFAGLFVESVRLHDGVVNLLKQWPDKNGDEAAKVLQCIADQVEKLSRKNN